MGGFCAAVGCSNHRNEPASAKKKTEKEKISFFKLPKDQKVAAVWIARINRTSLPANVYLCEKHFTEDCFQRTADFVHHYMKGNFTL